MENARRSYFRRAFGLSIDLVGGTGTFLVLTTGLPRILLVLIAAGIAVGIPIDVTTGIAVGIIVILRHATHPPSTQLSTAASFTIRTQNIHFEKKMIIVKSIRTFCQKKFLGRGFKLLQFLKEKFLGSGVIQDTAVHGVHKGGGTVTVLLGI